MANKLISKALTHLWDEDYKRIISGKRLNLVNRPYTIIYFDNMISHYEDIEEYEKCQVLSEVRAELLNHEIGYIK
jgi:hypothetical protein